MVEIPYRLLFNEKPKPLKMGLSHIFLAPIV